MSVPIDIIDNVPFALTSKPNAVMTSKWFGFIMMVIIWGFVSVGWFLLFACSCCSCDYSLGCAFLCVDCSVKSSVNMSMTDLLREPIFSWGWIVKYLFQSTFLIMWLSLWHQNQTLSMTSRWFGFITMVIMWGFVAFGCFLLFACSCHSCGYSLRCAILCVDCSVNSTDIWRLRCTTLTFDRRASTTSLSSRCPIYMKDRTI
jgi:hypothetical protein